MKLRLAIIAVFFAGMVLADAVRQHIVVVDTIYIKGAVPLQRIVGDTTDTLQLRVYWLSQLAEMLADSTGLAETSFVWTDSDNLDTLLAAAGYKVIKPEENLNEDQ